MEDSTAKESRAVRSRWARVAPEQIDFLAEEKADCISGVHTNDSGFPARGSVRVE